MRDKDFVDQLREKNADSNVPKKRWGSYSPAEVEAYIQKLNDKIKQTERIFQEQNQDLKSSLRAVTRERDELLQKVGAVQQQKIGDNQMVDLERVLGKRGLIAVPKEAYESLKRVDDDNAYKLEQLEIALEQTKRQYQALVKEHQELQNEFTELSKNKSSNETLSEDEKDKYYQNICKNQHAALARLKDALSTTMSQLENIIDRKLDDWDFPLGGDDDK